MTLRQVKPLCRDEHLNGPPRHVCPYRNTHRPVVPSFGRKTETRLRSVILQARGGRDGHLAVETTQHCNDPRLPVQCDSQTMFPDGVLKAVDPPSALASATAAPNATAARVTTHLERTAVTLALKWAESQRGHVSCGRRPARTSRPVLDTCGRDERPAPPSSLLAPTLSA
jgi:hypothetical protein